MSKQHLLEGMQKLEEDSNNVKTTQLEKQEQKFWNNKVNMPLTLQEGLSTFTKDELNEIRKNLGIKGVSKLKKSELVDLFADEIPNYLEMICRKLDEERFHLLIKIAKNDGFLHVPNVGFSHVRYLRASGLIFTGKVNGENAFVLPHELIEPLMAMERNLNVRSVIKRNTEWIQLTAGLLFYYGALTHSELEEFVTFYTKEPFSPKEYFAVINDASTYYAGIHFDKNGYYYMDVDDPEMVRREQSRRKNLSFYPLKKEQILEASAELYIDRNKSYMNLFHYILKNYDISSEEVDIILEDCIVFIQNGDDLDEVLDLIGERLEFDNDSQFIGKVVDLMNNTRKWVLKGHTPAELSEQVEKPAQPIPRRVVKIGRNEPCPCGSGKKYKKCCGR